MPLRGMPVITVALIAVMVATWLLGLSAAPIQPADEQPQVSRAEVWITTYGAFPCELLGHCRNQQAVGVVDSQLPGGAPQRVVVSVPDRLPALTLVTSLFLHGGLLHLSMNVLLLWVFGRQIEDAVHPVSYLAGFVGAGMAAGLAQAWLDPFGTSPIIGASGAIAGILGVYLATYPRARVLLVIVPPITRWVPAWTIIGTWALLQLAGTWASIIAPAGVDASVAWAAHACGLLLGWAVGRLLVDSPNPAYAEELMARGR